MALVLVVLDIMGRCGITLDPYTILIADISIGILDKDTLHFVKHVDAIRARRTAGRGRSAERGSACGFI